MTFCFVFFNFFKKAFLMKNCFFSYIFALILVSVEIVNKGWLKKSMIYFGLTSMEDTSSYMRIELFIFSMLLLVMVSFYFLYLLMTGMYDLGERFRFSFYKRFFGKGLYIVSGFCFYTGVVVYLIWGVVRGIILLATGGWNDSMLFYQVESYAAGWEYWNQIMIVTSGSVIILIMLYFVYVDWSVDSKDLIADGFSKKESIFVYVLSFFVSLFFFCFGMYGQFYMDTMILYFFAWLTPSSVFVYEKYIDEDIRTLILVLHGGEWEDYEEDFTEQEMQDMGYFQKYINSFSAYEQHWNTYFSHYDMMEFSFIYLKDIKRQSKKYYETLSTKVFQSIFYGSHSFFFMMSMGREFIDMLGPRLMHGIDHSSSLEELECWSWRTMSTMVSKDKKDKVGD